MSASEPFCYEVFDLDSRESLGAGKDNRGGRIDDEMLFLLASIEWSRVYPDRGLHIEQISYEDYERSFGKQPDWRKDYSQLVVGPAAFGAA